MLPKNSLTLWGSIKNRFRGEITPILTDFKTTEDAVDAGLSSAVNPPSLAEHSNANVTPLPLCVKLT